MSPGHSPSLLSLLINQSDRRSFTQSMSTLYIFSWRAHIRFASTGSLTLCLIKSLFDMKEPRDALTFSKIPKDVVNSCQRYLLSCQMRQCTIEMSPFQHTHTHTLFSDVSCGCICGCRSHKSQFWHISQNHVISPYAVPLAWSQSHLIKHRNNAGYRPRCTNILTSIMRIGRDRSCTHTRVCIDINKVAS